MSTVFSRFSEDVVVLEVAFVIGNKGDVRMCCFGLGDPLIMPLKATRERRKERKRSSKDRKKRGKGGREEGRRFMTVLICESPLWHRSDDFALYTSFVPHRAKYLLRALHVEPYERVFRNVSNSFIASNLQSNASL